MNAQPNILAIWGDDVGCSGHEGAHPERIMID